MGTAVCLLVLASSWREAGAISFSLGANARKCLQEDVDKDQLVVGEYTVSETDAIKVNLEVCFPFVCSVQVG